MAGLWSQVLQYMVGLKSSGVNSCGRRSGAASNSRSPGKESLRTSAFDIYVVWIVLILFLRVVSFLGRVGEGKKRLFDLSAYSKPQPLIQFRCFFHSMPEICYKSLSLAIWKFNHNK